MRDTGILDVRTVIDAHDIQVPNVGASYQNTAPSMDPFLVTLCPRCGVRQRQTVHRQRGSADLRVRHR